MRGESLEMYSLCLLPMLFVFVFTYLPMGGLVIAFKRYQYNLGIFGSPWVGFKNFEAFITSNDFIKVTSNTLYLNALFIIFGTLSAVFLGILLFKLTSRKWTKVFQTILITPHFLSWVVVGSFVFALLSSENGVINNIIAVFGMEKVDWYSRPGAWPEILTMTSIWKSVGIDAVVYYAALMGIDSTLYEAASIDGASNRQQTRYITIPCITSLIVILTILKIGNIFRADFGLFYQVTRDSGRLYSRTDVIDTYIFRTMRVSGNMGMSSAAGLMQSVVGFVLVNLVDAISKKIDSDYGLF